MLTKLQKMYFHNGLSPPNFILIESSSVKDFGASTLKISSVIKIGGGIIMGF